MRNHYKYRKSGPWLIWTAMGFNPGKAEKKLQRENLNPLGAFILDRSENPAFSFKTPEG
jgi:hypothetical protein